MSEEASTSSGGSSGASGGSGGSASMAAFVPSTVMSCERTAMQVASRVTAPVRSVASRALSFADRIMGTWSGGGNAFAAEPSPMQGAFGGAMTVAEPWYQRPAETTQAIDPSWDGISGFRPTFSRPVSTATSASRGASIPRTAVTAAARPAPSPELNAITLSATDIARTLVDLSSQEAPAPVKAKPVETRPIETKPAAQSEAPATPVKAEAKPQANVDATAQVRSEAKTAGAPVAGVEAAMTAAPTAELRAAEALGITQLTAASQPERPTSRPSLAAPRSPLARALGHTAWVDSQLRTLALGAESVTRADNGHVFVSPSMSGDAAAGEAAARSIAASAMPQLAVSTTAPARTATTEASRTSATQAAPLASPSTRAPSAATPSAAPSTRTATPTSTTPSASTTTPSRTTTPTATTPAPPSFAPSTPSLTMAPLATLSTAPAATATWTPAVSAALPNPGLTPSVPPAATATTDRIARFLSGLVGTQSAADAAPLPLATAPSASATAAWAGATGRELLTASPVAARTEETARPSQSMPLTAPLQPQTRTLESAPESRPVAGMPSPSTSRPGAQSSTPSTSTSSTSTPPSSMAPSSTPSPGTPSASTPSLATPSPSAPWTSAQPVGGAPTSTRLPATPSATERTVERQAMPPLVLPSVPAASEATAPSAPASFRPGMMAARSEQLGSTVDARINAAWGTPVTTASLAPRAESMDMLAPPSREPETMHAATGPARMAQFLESLVGVQTVRATAPLPVIDSTATATASEPATETTAPLASSRRAPDRVPLSLVEPPRPFDAAEPRHGEPMRGEHATSAATASAATAPGGIGVRAEQLAGQVGTRAASLSLDFVDPARLSVLNTPAPAMPTIQPEARATEPATSETIMPAPRPLLGATSAPQSQQMSAEEWSLVATFPSASTAIQMMAARQAAQWQPDQLSPERLASAGPQTLLTERPDASLPATAMAPTASTGASFSTAPGAVDLPLPTAMDTREPASRSAPSMDLVTAGPTPTPTPTVMAEDRVQLPGGRSPRGSFTWPKLANVVESPAEWMPATTMAAESGAHAAPGMPMWGAMQPLVTVAPQPAEAERSAAAQAAAMPTLTPSAPATEAPRAEAHATDTASLASAADAPAMTLATALPPETRALVDAAGSPARGATPSATSESRATSAASAPTTTASSASSSGPAAPASVERAASLMRAVAIGDGSSAADTSSTSTTSAAPFEARRRSVPDMPTITPSPSAPPVSGAAARALELAKPFLRLVGNGSDATSKPAMQRFCEQPQPVVAGSPASEAAKQMMTAARTQPATSTSDDRISLADLTLISLASATNQIAASPEGASPAPAASGSSAGGGGGAASSGGSDGKDQVQEVENLAREAFEELQRLITIARERSGDPWES